MQQIYHTARATVTEFGLWGIGLGTPIYWFYGAAAIGGLDSDKSGAFSDGLVSIYNVSIRQY